MASSASALSINPRGLEPFPIETNLATAAAAGSPGIAMQQLAGYQFLRNMQGQQYQDELEANRQLAYQNLAAEIAKNRTTGLTGLIGHPGGLAILAGSPSLRSEYLPDVNEDVLASQVGLQNRSQVAGILDKAAGAAYHGVEAGQPIPSSELTGLTGLTFGQGTPLALRTAALHAAAADGGLRASIQAAPIPGVGPVSLSVPKGWSMDKAVADARNKGWLPPADAIAGGDQTQVGPRTSLPMAKQDEGSGSPTTSAQPSGSTAPARASTTGNKQVMDQVRAAVEAHRSQMSPEMYNDIVAGYKMNGGNPIIRNGKLYGAKGGPYS